ncbi:MAG: hypothetical protein QOF02_3985 [Blastocatellia bacterium]|jgi:hypothetical protein|nr:hypothetical protein [Blastocatellia bacterium]
MNNFVRAAAVVVMLFEALCGSASETRAQKSRPGARRIINAARVDNSPEEFRGGPLYVTINGRERKLAERALRAWIIEGGRRVVYSSRGGAGGYENEGQSLTIYDARTGRRRNIMSEYVEVDKLTAVTTRTKRTALLLEMSDGGLGASYLAVVDPERGEVFHRRWARLLSRRGDTILIGHYNEDAWWDLSTGEKIAVKPYKRERQDLSAILRRPVIYNKPDFP